MCLSDPIWALQKPVSQQAGIKDFDTYPYYDKINKCFDFLGMIRKLNEVPEKSVIILHACAHNPTGMDPNEEQWKEIMKICRSRCLLPFFDLAYQGFATGDLDRDALPVRMFANEGLELICAESFAKNAGLYGERIGALHFLCKNSELADTLLSQMKMLIRMTYSCSPMHGARIMTKILNDSQLFELWKAEMKLVSGRMKDIRTKLRNKLEELNTPGNWDHIVKQIGMYCFSGLTSKNLLLYIS